MKHIGYISEQDRQIIIQSGRTQQIIHYTALSVTRTDKIARGRDATDDDPDLDNMSSYDITIRDNSGHVTEIPEIYLYSNHPTSKKAYAWNALNEKS